MDSESTTPGFVAPYRFAIIPEWILYTPELESPQVHLFGILVRYGGRIFPSHGTLAGQMRRSERSIIRDLKALEKAGALRRTPRFDETGRQTSNLYELAGDDPFVTDDGGEGDTHVTQEVVTGVTPINESNKERETGTLTGSTSRQSAQLALTEDAEIVDESWRLAEFKEAIVAVCGEPSTPSGWGLVNRLADFIRSRGDPPESVALRATLMAQQWGPEKVTVASLEKHWTRYDPGRVGRLSQEDIDEYHRQVQDLKFRQRLDEIGET